jgi:NAD(P)-dependent dehydrogenase (short-subunit alcohol dehydrogenase family)
VTLVERFRMEMTDTLPPGELESVQQITDLQRIGEQQELDAAVLFLASNAASYITGITLAVDGGLTGH